MTGYVSYTMFSLEILEASDFDKVAGTAVYYLQYYHMYFVNIVGKVAGRSHGSNRRYRRPPTLVGNTGYIRWIPLTKGQWHGPLMFLC